MTKIDKIAVFRNEDEFIYYQDNQIELKLLDKKTSVFRDLSNLHYIGFLPGLDNGWSERVLTLTFKNEEGKVEVFKFSTLFNKEMISVTRGQEIDVDELNPNIIILFKEIYHGIQSIKS